MPFEMDCQGNLILPGLAADINVMPQSPAKPSEDRVQACDCTVFGRTVQQRKREKKQQQRLIHLPWLTDVTRMTIAATSEGAAATHTTKKKKSQGQVCQLKCATVVE